MNFYHTLRPRGAIDGDGVQHFVVCQRLPRLQGIWEVDIGEELSCQRENGIRTDPFAVRSGCEERRGNYHHRH